MHSLQPLVEQRVDEWIIEVVIHADRVRLGAEVQRLHVEHGSFKIGLRSVETVPNGHLKINQSTLLLCEP